MKRSPRPPRLATWLLERFLPAPERDAFLGDLAELWSGRPGGFWASRRWYWFQALAAIVTVRAPRAHRITAWRAGSRGTGSPFGRDLRLAARQLHRAPAYAGVVIGTLAIGIGAVTAVFSVANPVLFQPLPFPDPDRLAIVWEVDKTGSSSRIGYATFADLRRDSRTLENVAAVSSWTPVLLGRGTSTRLEGQSVTHDFFATLGVSPALGRNFTAEEDVARGDRVVILADGLWRRRFGADRSLIGRQIDLSGSPYTVVGVLPASFESVLAPGAELWRPLGYAAADPWGCRTCRHLRMVARLPADQPLATVESELDGLLARYRSLHPTEYATVGLRAEPLAAHLTERVRPALMLALVAAVFVLLIAGANVANLLLARAVERQSEFAVRAALGAGRWTLVRQLLTEGWLLAVGGALGGLLIAWGGIESLLAGSSLALPRLARVGIDWSVLAVALGLTLPIALLAGLGPAVLAARRGLSGLASRAITHSRGRRRSMSGLVVAEIALAVMLLTGAGLLVQSLRRVLAIEPGFDAESLLAMEVIAAGPRYQEDSAVWRMQERLLDAVRGAPGVVSAALASQIPLGGNLDTYGVQIEEQPLENPDQAPSADRYAVSGAYHSTMRIPVLRGRGFDRRDVRGGPHVVLVNQTFARLAWPGEDPIGKRIRMGGETWRTIVGVVGDVRHAGLDAERTRQFYVPSAQWQWAESHAVLVVRTVGQPGAVTGRVRQAVLSVDPELAVTGVATGEALIARATSQRRLLMRLFEMFALAALLLSAAGIYGLLGRSVAERARELGIRVALGADRGRIFRLVVGRGAGLTALGAGLGLLGAVATAGALRSLLFGIAPADPFTLVAAAAILGLVALSTCLMPAVRATRVDPVAALKQE